jgi:uncharacterized membrane protein
LRKALELAGVAIIVGELSSQVGGFSAMGAAQVTCNLLILNAVRILDAVSYLGLSCSWGQTFATITAPLTILSVGLLAGIVLIRTFLSFSLETEIEGCWPWQRAAKDAVRGERDQR